jgi:hypothetical protein
MRLLALVLAFALIAFPAAAHPGHDMDAELSPRQLANSSAMYTVNTMVARGILDESWRGAEPVSLELRDRNRASEWVATFRNNAIANPAQRTLYVIMTPMGEYIAANYTGQ